MAAIAIWRWILFQQLRNPAVGLLGLGLGFATFLTLGLRALPWAGDPAASLTTWAHPAGVLGVALALASLSRGEAFLARVDRRTRFWGELGALLAVPTYLQLPILAAGLLSSIPPADGGASTAAILRTDLQLASVALLFLLPPFSTALRTSLFLVAVVLLPALCAGTPELARLAPWLDAGAAPAAPATFGAGLAASASLLLVAHLLRTRPARRPAA